MKQVISSFSCFFLLLSAFLVLHFMVKVSGNQEGGFLLLFLLFPHLFDFSTPVYLIHELCLIEL